MACHEDAAKDCEIENWCVCQWAWEMYVKKQGCENIVDLHCESVNMKALEACASCTSRTNARSHPGPTSQSARVPSASLARAQRVPSACPGRGRRVRPDHARGGARVSQSQVPRHRQGEVDCARPGCALRQRNRRGFVRGSVFACFFPR